MKYKFTITIVIICTLLSHDVGWTVGVSFNHGKSSLPEINKSINFYIPENYGYITKKYSGIEKNKPTLILIEDAHCISEIQKNISNIIKYSINNFGLKKVCLEGASGDITTSPFREYPDKQKRKRIMAYYLEEGILNGVEFLSITEGKNISLGISGVEDEDLYLSNLRVFRRHYSGMVCGMESLKRVENILEVLKQKFYNKLLLEWDQREKLYKSGELPINEYILWLRERFNERDFVRNKWAQAYLIIRLLSLENKINFDLVDAERANLIDYLTQNLPEEDKKDLIEKALLLKLLKINGRDFYSYLNELLSKNPYLNVNGRYPNLLRYIRLVCLQKFTDYQKLELEIEDMSKKVFSVSCKTDIEQETCNISEAVFLWNCLVKLEINKRQFEKYKTLKINVKDALLFLAKYSAQTREIIKEEEINKIMSSALEFYAFAQKRDSIIAGNINNIAKKSEDKYVAIVVGGFHSEAIQEELKEYGYSYIVVTPRIVNKPNQEKYAKIMMSRHIKLDLENAEKSTLPPPVATSSTGYRITDFPKEIAGRLTGEITLRDVLKKYGSKLTPEDRENLQKLYEMAGRLSVVSDKEAIRRLISEMFKGPVSPTLREALHELFGDIYFPTGGEIEIESPVEMQKEEGGKLFKGFFTEQKYQRLFQRIMFAYFLVITVFGIFINDTTNSVLFLQEWYLILLIAYSVISIMRGLVDMRGKPYSLKNAISEKVEQRSLATRIIQNPMVWFMLISSLLMVNTYLYEAVTGLSLKNNLFKPEIWNSMFLGIKKVMIGLDPHIYRLIKNIIVGKVNDVLAVPFIVYAFLSIIRLYSKKLYGYFNKSYFKPLLILGSGLAFIYSEVEGGAVGRTDSGTFIYNYQINDITDYYTYIAVTAIMLAVYFMGRIYDYIRGKKTVTLDEAFKSISKIKHKNVYLATFFMAIVPFVYFMYFMYTIPFFHKFTMLYSSLPIILGAVILMPIIFWLRCVYLERLEKRSFLPKIKARAGESSNVSFMYEWGGMLLIIFSGISLLVRYLWNQDLGAYGSIIIILAIPFIAGGLTAYYRSVKKTHGYSEADSVNNYVNSLSNPMTTFFVSSITGVLAGKYLAVKGIWILKKYSESKGWAMNPFEKTIGKFLHSFSGWFGEDLVIFVSISVFVITFMFVYFVVWPAIVRQVDKIKGYDKIALLVPDTAKVKPGQKQLPIEVAKSLIKWIKEEQKGKIRMAEKPYMHTDIPDILVFQSDIDLSGWEFRREFSIYKAKFKDGKIIVEYEDIDLNVKGEIEVYALRDERGEGTAILLSSEILSQIKDIPSCLRQLGLHETAEMLFQRYMQEEEGTARERYDVFIREFVKKIGEEWPEIDFVYKKNLIKILNYKQVGKYFDRQVYLISGHDFANLIERVDTILLGSKRYDFKDMRNSLGNLDSLVMYSDLEWEIFFHYLTEMLEDITLVDSATARDVFGEYKSLYLEDIMRDFREKLDTGMLKKFLDKERILEKIDKGHIKVEETKRETLIGNINFIKFVLSSLWISSAVFFFFSLFIGLNTAGWAFIVNSGILTVLSVVLMVYYVNKKQGKGQEDARTPWSRFRLHPATYFLLIIGLLLLNQYFLNAFAIYSGINFTLPSYFSEGWFNLIKDPAIFKPVLDLAQFIKINIPSAYNAFVSVWGLSMLRVNAFLELPFALFAYFTIVRLLNKDLYYFLRKSWFNPLAIFSFTSILCLVELGYPNPFTYSDIVTRLISAFFFFGLFIAGKIKDSRSKEKISFPAESINRIPNKGFNLGIFFTGFTGVSAVVLLVYEITLLYNFSMFFSYFWPFIIILAATSIVIYMKPVLMQIYSRIRTKLFSAEHETRTFNANLFTYFYAYLLAGFFAVSLFIRYMAESLLGVVSVIVILVMTMVLLFARMKEQGWDVKQIMRAAISLAVGFAVGMCFLMPNILTLGYFETALFKSIIVFFVPFIFTSIGLEAFFIKLAEKYTKKKKKDTDKQASKTRRGQPAVTDKLARDLIKWIKLNCQTEKREGVFHSISDNNSLTAWGFSEGDIVYTAYIERGEIKIVEINSKTGEKIIMDVQALRDKKGEIWLLESVYNIIKEDANAIRQLLMHELAEDIFQKMWAKDGSGGEKHQRFIGDLLAAIIDLEPRYKGSENKFRQLLSYDNIKQYLMRDLTINDADRLAELIEKIDTQIMGSCSGKIDEVKNLKDLDNNVATSDLDWSLFYNSLRIALAGEGVINLPSSFELRKIFNGIEGIDINVLRNKLDNPDKMQEFISILKDVSTVCDNAGDTANLGSTEVVNKRKADVALNISYNIFQQRITDGKVKELVGEYLTGKIKTAIEDKYTSSEQKAVWELIDTLGKQIMRLEEREGKKQLVVDSFSYLLAIELERELGLEKFSLLSVLLKARISSGLAEYYKLDNTNAQRRKRVEEEQDPYARFLKDNGVSYEFVVTVADLVYQLANYRLEQGITKKDLSEFKIRIPRDMGSGIFKIVSKILGKAIEEGIEIKEQDMVFCGVSSSGIDDELGERCAVFKNDIALALAKNYGLPYQRGDIKTTLTKGVSSQLCEFTNDAVYLDVSPVLLQTGGKDIELGIIDFEACFEIEEVRGNEVRIIPRTVNIKEVLKKLPEMRKVCFASMNPSLIALHGEKIKQILSKVYGLNELNNVFLDEIFTGSVLEIAQAVNTQFNLGDYKKTILISSQKNQEIVQDAVKKGEMPFRAVVANNEAPFSYALGLSILANTITDRDTDLLKKYFSLIGIEITDEYIEEIKRNGFMLFILPSPKPIIKEMINALSSTRITIDVSA